jgi:hypothetical protein
VWAYYGITIILHTEACSVTAILALTLHKVHSVNTENNLTSGLWPRKKGRCAPPPAHRSFAAPPGEINDK